MSIRIRTVHGVRVALCAARSMPKAGDVYLDDADHHALMIKFELDLASEGALRRAPLYGSGLEAHIMEVEESNNPNRTWWDSVYRPMPGGVQPERES